MPNHVLEIDCSGGINGLEAVFTSAPYSGPYATIWVEADLAFNSTYLTALLGGVDSDEPILLSDGSGGSEEILVDPSGSGGWTTAGRSGFTFGGAPSGGVLSAPLAPLQFYHLKLRVTAGTPATADAWIDGTSLGSITMTGIDIASLVYLDIQAGIVTTGGALAWFDNVIVGTTEGGSDILSDDFEGVGAPSAAIWNSGVNGTVIEDPGIAPAADSLTPLIGRVGIAFDDGPLEPSPTWTFIDQGGSFPENFVSGYDVRSGRQTLLTQTDTGTATVYIYDHEQALFDPRNVSSTYFGKLDGKQILLQLWDPEASAWESQFRGLIDDITWDIDGSAVGSDGEPINATIQIECVDMFDYLAGYGLTPGLDGVTPRSVPSGGTAGGTPPAGYEDGVYYAQTAGTVDDRIIEILTDVGIDSTRYTVASGNVSVKAVKYDPDESALQGLRDAADAELPFIGNIYCDRHGDFLFRGRYSRFDPDAVAAEPGSTWDFTRWAAGDGAAITADSTRAQLRTFAFGRSRSDLINVAICYPQGMAASKMPNQVYADTTSITAYGKHSAPPMSDLLTNEGSVSGGGFTTTDVQECYLFAKLTVLNQKDPRENITTLGFKEIHPNGSTRSVQTWALMTKADISHIVNVAVGYPQGTGLAGDSPTDDYYIEGRQLQVRPLNLIHDQVDLELAVSPAVWSMDTNSVFPAFPGADAAVLTADFTSAE